MEQRMLNFIAKIKYYKIKILLTFMMLIRFFCWHNNNIKFIKLKKEYKKD